MAHTLIKHSHSAPTDCLLCVLAPLCTKRKKYFVSFLFNQWGESVWPGRVMWDLFAVVLNFKWQIKVKLHARFEPGWAWTDASSAEGDTVLPWRRCQSSLSVTKVFEKKKCKKRCRSNDYALFLSAKYLFYLKLLKVIHPKYCFNS